MDDMHYVQADISQLCDMLHRALRLQEIRWDSVWDVTHFRGCLKSFSRLYAQHPKVISSVLEGERQVHVMCVCVCACVCVHGCGCILCAVEAANATNRVVHNTACHEPPSKAYLID